MDQGISLIIVEHNLSMIAAADHVIEMGPGAGKRGGKVIYQGDPAGLMQDRHSVTGPYLARAFQGFAPTPAVASQSLVG